jgi:hypothetical protein
MRLTEQRIWAIMVFLAAALLWLLFISFVLYGFVGWRASTVVQRRVTSLGEPERTVFDADCEWWGMFSAEGVIAIGYEREHLSAEDESRFSSKRMPLGSEKNFGFFILNGSGAAMPVFKNPADRVSLLGLGIGTVRPWYNQPSSYHYAHRVRFPYWWLFAVFVVTFIIRFRKRQKIRSRIARGLCPTCGYDLRATPDRCPECGSAVPPRASPDPPGKEGEIPPA